MRCTRREHEVNAAIGETGGGWFAGTFVSEGGEWQERPRAVLGLISQEIHRNEIHPESPEGGSVEMLGFAPNNERRVGNQAFCGSGHVDWVGVARLSLRRNARPGGVQPTWPTWPTRRPVRSRGKSLGAKRDGT